jgi:2,5-diketo-D-gluconate reductase A
MMEIRLNNGITMPQLGFGVYLINDNELCKQSVLTALKNGYRLIDTAAVYRNERGTGQAIKESGIERKEIFLTTKIWVQDYGYEKTRVAIDGALKRLQVDYVDLMLLHQPYSDYLGSWKAMEEAFEAGKLRSIGLSNFKIKKLQQVLDMAKIKPAVNQVECHPYFQQRELKAFQKKYDIALEAWYPIGHGSKDLLNEKTFTQLAEKYSKSPVQVILRWHVQVGNIAIPKSTNPKHIISNIDIFDFELSNDEMEAIRGLDRNKGYFTIPEFLMSFFTKLIKIKY